MSLRLSTLTVLAAAASVASAQTVLFNDPFLSTESDSLNTNFNTRQSGSILSSGQGIPYSELTGTGPIGSTNGKRRTMYNLPGSSSGLTFQSQGYNGATPPAWYSSGETSATHASAVVFDGSTFGTTWPLKQGGDVSFNWASPVYNFKAVPDGAGGSVGITDGFDISFSVDPGQDTPVGQEAADYGSIVFGSANRGRFGGTAAGTVPSGETATNSEGFGMAFYANGGWAAYDGTTLVGSGTGLATSGLVPVVIRVEQAAFGSGNAVISASSGGANLFSYTRAAFNDNYITLGGFAGGISGATASGNRLAGHSRTSFGFLEVRQLAPVPEPASMAVLGLGLAALRRRRSRK